MKYALGNMLNGAGSLNPDGLSLDLQFADDKTLTARKGPTPVFTRASSATQVGATGLIEYAPENQLNFSQSFATSGGANNSWADVSFARTTGFADPIGGFTAIRFTTTATSATVISTNAVGSSELRTFSFWMRRVTGSGSIQYTVDGGATYTTIASSTLPTTWTRFSFTSTADHRVGFRSALTNQAIEIWGAQLERSSTTRTYIPTTTAAVYGARFDHDPVTLACKGLLIEEGRTNTLIQSNDFANAAWTKANIGIGSTTNLSPDGSNNATLLIAGTAAVSWIFRSGITASGSTVTFFAKSSGKGWAVVDASSGSGTAGVWFDLQNGVVGTVQSGYTASIQQFPNGFYRCRVTYPSSGAGTFCVIGVSDNNGLFISTGNGSNGIILYGAQLEAGSFPTSYIPTTTASLARSADVCSITGANFSGFWNRFAGTCVIGVGSSLGTSPRFVSNLVAARTLEIYGTTNIDFFEASGAQEVRIVTTSTYPVKLGLAYAINDYQSSYNGLLGGSDTNTGGTIPNATELHIGNLGAASNRLTGHIQSIRYFKKRLSNAKLQSITA